MKRATVVNRMLGDIRALIEAARAQTAQVVNSAMVGLYWHIGRRIRADVLQEKRAEYGKAIISTLSNKLIVEYGRGYSPPNLARMMWLAEAFPDPEIFSTLSKELSWSHFVEILPLKDPLKRDFYAELCRAERWDVRTLRQKIGHLLYERTAVSKKPDELIAQDLATLRDEDQMTPDLVFRDPYFLDFLSLTGVYAEKDVEQAILRDLEAFILELGGDFAFVPGKNESRLITKIIISTCCFTIADCDVSWRSSSNWTASRQPTRANGTVSSVAGETRHAAR